MSRVLDGEKEALKQAADAASGMIVKLRAQRAQIDERLAALQHVVDAYEVTSGKRHPSLIGSTSRSDEKRKRAKKGQVAQQIEAALSDGAEREVKELRDKIENMFGIHYGRGTIYSALGREENKKFVRSGNRWKINPLLVKGS
jgi:hypothetical protein